VFIIFIQQIDDFLNLNSTSETIGVSYDTVANFSSVSFLVNNDFEMAYDEIMTSEIYVAQLLERGEQHYTTLHYGVR